MTASVRDYGTRLLSSLIYGCNAVTARARWLCAFFSPGFISAAVIVAPSGIKIESYPKPASPLAVSAIFPGHWPRKIFSSRPGTTTPTRPPSGEDPGRPAHDFHGEPGIIRKGDAIGVTGGRPGLDEGIITEGCPVFTRFRPVVRGPNKPPRGSAEDLLEFNHLVRVVCGQNDLPEHPIRPGDRARQAGWR